MKKRPGQKRKRVEATADNSDRNGRTKEAEAAADGDRQRYRGGNMMTRSVHTSFSPRHQFTLPAVHDISLHFLQSTTSVYTSISPRHQFTFQPTPDHLASHGAMLQHQTSSSDVSLDVSPRGNYPFDGTGGTTSAIRTTGRQGKESIHSH